MKKIFFLIFVIAIVSCQKATIDEVPVKNNSLTSLTNVTSKDGRLIFKNKTDFNATVKMLFDNQKSIKNFESQFAGFTSNKQAFERIDSTFLKSINYNYDLISNYAIIRETPEGKSLERVIDMHLLAYLFNDEGILQIGDSIFKFSYDFTYKFNIDKLSQLKSAKINMSMDGVTAYPNIRNRFELPESNLKSAMASVSEVTYWWVPNTTHFIKSELNRNITYLLNTLTVDTKSRKKNWLGIGVSYQVYGVSAEANGYYRWRGGEFEYLGNIYFNVSDQNTGGATDVQETIVSSGNISSTPEFVPGTTTGTHWMKQYDYSTPKYSPNTSY